MWRMWSWLLSPPRPEPWSSASTCAISQSNSPSGSNGRCRGARRRRTRRGFDPLSELIHVRDAVEDDSAVDHDSRHGYLSTGPRSQLLEPFDPFTRRNVDDVE